MCPGITALNRNKEESFKVVLWRHRWWHKHYKDGIWQNVLHRLRFWCELKPWSNVWKSHMAAKCGVRKLLKQKMKPKLRYHSSIATCLPYIPFLFHLDAIKNDRATSKQISGSFGEIVTLSFDVLFLGIVSWYAYPINLITILVLFHKTLALKIAPRATAS